MRRWPLFALAVVALGAAPRPGVAPDTPWSCPAAHPIKGYVSVESGRRVYYMPGARFYEEASPERCYASEDEARRDGSRPPGDAGPLDDRVDAAPAPLAVVTRDTVRGMSHEPMRRRAIVVQPGEGPSYWQPVPANGHADPALFAANTGFGSLAMGYMLGYDVKHEIVNDGEDELVMRWVITPPGLEKFFQAVGRPRTAGDAAPAPFARPDDVVAIERALGMNDTR